MPSFGLNCSLKVGVTSTRFLLLRLIDYELISPNSDSEFDWEFISFLHGDEKADFLNGEEGDKSAGDVFDLTDNDC